MQREDITGVGEESHDNRKREKKDNWMITRYHGKRGGSTNKRRTQVQFSGSDERCSIKQTAGKQS